MVNRCLVYMCEWRLALHNSHFQKVGGEGEIGWIWQMHLWAFLFYMANNYFGHRLLLFFWNKFNYLPCRIRCCSLWKKPFKPNSNREKERHYRARSILHIIYNAFIPDRDICNNICDHGIISRSVKEILSFGCAPNTTRSYDCGLVDAVWYRAFVLEQDLKGMI